MSPVGVAHVFFDTYMGYSFGGLGEILSQNKVEMLARGEVAVFINTKFSACKILTSAGVLAYCRGPGPGYVTPEVIKVAPTMFGGARLSFTRNLEKALLDEFAKVKGKKVTTARRLKVVGE